MSNVLTPTMTIRLWHSKKHNECYFTYRLEHPSGRTFRGSDVYEGHLFVAIGMCLERMKQLRWIKKIPEDPMSPILQSLFLSKHNIDLQVIHIDRKRWL